MSKYTRDYFIAKFEAIPEDQWCTGVFTSGGSHCAEGHLMHDPELRLDGVHIYAASVALSRLLRETGPSIPEDTNPIAFVNDGCAERGAGSPKARILAALRDLPATPEQTGLGKEEK